MASPVETLMREQLADRREKLDLDLAGRVMRGLLPPPSLSFPGHEIARHYEGAGPVGGDYCDALDARDGNLHFALGDVSGKGVAASMLMPHLHANPRALVPLGLPLDQLVARASGLFCDARFTVTRLRLSPGDTILLYTDGVSEARSAADKEYGIGRLSRSLAEGPARKPAETVKACLGDLQAFLAGAPKADDLTLMAIQRVE